MKNHYRIVALADIHAGGERWGVDAGRWTQPGAEAVDFAEENETDVIAVAGDLFHKRAPTPAEYYRALDLLWDPGREIPLLIIDGNHDVGAVKDSIAATWPFHDTRQPRFHVANGQAGIAVWDGDDWKTSAPGLQFLTLPWPRLCDYVGRGPQQPGPGLEEQMQNAREHCLTLLEFYGKKLDPRWPKVLIGHAMLAYGGGHEPNDPGLLLGKDIVLPTNAMPPMDAYLFGHVHQPDKWYLGSTQPTDFSDTGPKSFRVVDLTRQDDGAWKTETRRIPYKLSLKVWDLQATINGEGVETLSELDARHMLQDEYQAETKRRALNDGPRFDVARARITVTGGLDADAGMIRRMLAESYVDRVVSVEVVRPPTVARRLGEDGPVIATLSPDAALEAWLTATGKATAAPFRNRVIETFRTLSTTESAGTPQ